MHLDGRDDHPDDAPVLYGVTTDLGDNPTELDFNIWLVNPDDTRALDSSE